MVLFLGPVSEIRVFRGMGGINVGLTRIVYEVDSYVVKLGAI